MPDSKHSSDPNLGSAGSGTRKRPTLRNYLLCSLIFILSFAYLLNTFGSVPNRYPVARQPERTHVGFDWEKVTPSPKLEWHDCFENRQCARLEVPLDYNEPTGEKAAIAMMRIRAKIPPNDKKYRGPILFNPGGPGGSGVSEVNVLGESFQKLLGEEFDIIGFDPRGVGLTTPLVSVFSDPYERGYWNAGAPPLINSTSDSFLQSYTRSEIFGDLAVKRTMHPAEYVSTAIVARDMLTMTQAHGRDKLMYWGFSYGTVLGATYAALFPDNIERLAIDGVVDFDDYYSGHMSKNLDDTDKILQFFYDECSAAGTACPLYDNSSSLVQRRVENIFTSIKATPLPVLDGTGSAYGVVDYSMLKRHLFRALYNPFRALTQYAHVLAAIEQGDGGPALAYEQKFQQQPKCGAETPLPFFTADARIAIRCGEGEGARSDLPGIVEEFTELAEISVFADVWVEQTRGWKIKVKDRYGGPYNTTTHFPLLIIGNTADPVTPLVGAKKAAQGFKDSVLLTIDTPGHCSIAATSPSAIGHIRRYFREGILPPVGTVCDIEDKLFGSSKQGLNGTTQEDKDILDATRLLTQKFYELRQGYIL